MFFFFIASNSSYMAFSFPDTYATGRFGASFYVTTRDRFSLEKESGVVTASTAIDEM